MRAATYQEFTHESAEITRTMLANPEMLAANLEFLVEARTPVPLVTGAADVDNARFSLTAGLYLRNLQTGYLEVRRGRLDARLFESYVSYHVDSWVCQPGWLRWWQANRRHYDSEFATWIEAKRAEILTATDTTHDT